MMHSLLIAERTTWSWRLVYQKFTYSCNCLHLSQVLGSRILLLVFAGLLFDKNVYVFNTLCFYASELEVFITFLVLI